MSFSSCLRVLSTRSQNRRRRPGPRRPSAKLHLEQLETRLTPSFVLSTLASFNGANGSSPESGLAMDSSGNLYGTAYNGGASSDGTVFEVAQGTGTLTTLASFNGTNGSDPVTGLILDGSGNLYGAAEQGGARAAVASSSWSRAAERSRRWLRSALPIDGRSA